MNKAALCDCGTFVGIFTPSGIMMENLILIYFDGFCPGCGAELVYSNGNLICMPDLEREGNIG